MVANTSHCSTFTARHHLGRLVAPAEVVATARSTASVSSPERDLPASRTDAAHAPGSPAAATSPTSLIAVSTCARCTAEAAGTEVRPTISLPCRPDSLSSRPRPLSCRSCTLSCRPSFLSCPSSFQSCPSYFLSSRSRGMPPMRSLRSGSGRSLLIHLVSGHPVATTARCRCPLATASTTSGTPAAVLSAPVSARSAPCIRLAETTGSSCPTAEARWSAAEVMSADRRADQDARSATRSRSSERNSRKPCPVRAETARTGTPASPSSSSRRRRSARHRSTAWAGRRSTWLSTTSITSRCPASGRR